MNFVETIFYLLTVHYTGWTKKLDHFWRFTTPAYDDIKRRQYVQLVVRSKTDILNITIFKYSLHKFRENILHWKCQLF